jgi:hypothetical protein
MLLVVAVCLDLGPLPKMDPPPKKQEACLEQRLLPHPRGNLVVDLVGDLVVDLVGEGLELPSQQLVGLVEEDLQRRSQQRVGSAASGLLPPLLQVRLGASVLPPLHPRLEALAPLLPSPCLVAVVALVVVVAVALVVPVVALVVAVVVVALVVVVVAAALVVALVPRQPQQQRLPSVALVPLRLLRVALGDRLALVPLRLLLALVPLPLLSALVPLRLLLALVPQPLLLALVPLPLLLALVPLPLLSALARGLLPPMVDLLLLGHSQPGTV